MNESKLKARTGSINLNTLTGLSNLSNTWSYSCVRYLVSAPGK